MLFFYTKIYSRFLYRNRNSIQEVMPTYLILLTIFKQILYFIVLLLQFN